MSEPKKITKTSENTTGFLRLDFDKDQFDNLIETKGYPVIWERAVPCPCANPGLSPQSNCKNCAGAGWVFINPTEIKGIITSINKDTKYKEWSEERVGTFAITVNSKHRLNFMDRLTVIGSRTSHSETLKVKKVQSKQFIRTIYPAVEVIDIFKFQNVFEKLKLLNFQEDYVLEGTQVIFLKGVDYNDNVTVTYLHELQYHVLDLNHDVRNTVTLDNSSREQIKELPISAVARKTHRVINSYEFAGDEIFNNSYK